MIFNLLLFLDMNKNKNLKCIEMVTLKRIRFSSDAKSFDGTSKNVILFYKTLMKYIECKFDNFYYILKIVKRDMNLLDFFITETEILKTKLEEFQEEKLIQEIMDQMDCEEEEIEKEEDPYWDLEYYKNAAKKRQIPIGVPVIRHGSRDINEPISPLCLPELTKFLFLLYEAKELLSRRKK